MSKPKLYDVTLRILFPKRIVDRLKKRATSQHVSMSELVRRIIITYLDAQRASDGEE